MICMESREIDAVGLRFAHSGRRPSIFRNPGSRESVFPAPFPKSNPRDELALFREWLRLLVEALPRFLRHQDRCTPYYYCNFLSYQIIDSMYACIISTPSHSFAFCTTQPLHSELCHLIRSRQCSSRSQHTLT
jgi:hypothetical protein